MAHRFPGRPPGSQKNAERHAKQQAKRQDERQDKDRPKDKLQARPLVILDVAALAERQAKKTLRKTSRDDRPNLKLQGRMAEDDTDTVASSIHDHVDGGDFHRLASEFFDDDDSFWSLPGIPQRPQHQHHSLHPQTKEQTLNRFPGRPPGSTDLNSDSVSFDFRDLASESFAEDEVFWSLPEVQQQQQDRHRHRQQRSPGFVNDTVEGDFQRLASEFFDDDDSFWSLPDIQQQLQRPPHQPLEALSPPTSASSATASHLIPSQVYMKRSNRRRIDSQPCIPRIAIHAQNPYSENDIRHSCVPVCYRSTKPPYGPPVEGSPDLNPAPTTYSSPAIPKTKSWRY